MAVQDALAEKTSRKNEAVKLTKNMSIADMIKAMEPEIKKALPQVITPERFTRMALSALNTTPKLALFPASTPMVYSQQVIFLLSFMATLEGGLMNGMPSPPFPLMAKDLIDRHLPADLSVVLADLKLAGSHIHSHDHLGVDRLGCGKSSSDADLRVYQLSGLVWCESHRDGDLSLFGRLCVLVLDVLAHLDECLVDLFSEGSACQSVEVDIAVDVCLFHWTSSLLSNSSGLLSVVSA